MPNKRLVLVGDGTQRATLEKLAQQLGVADITTFKGAMPREQLPKVLADFSVFVFPSTRESFGLVAVEALACGVPRHCQRPATRRQGVPARGQERLFL
ncbi:hypothetical protein DK37_21525 [Halomonas sp. SUBG004]|nr:hypothetical protein DK37_21525 [Halomonas sp. SUBG004]